MEIAICRCPQAGRVRIESKGSRTDSFACSPIDVRDGSTLSGVHNHNEMPSLAIKRGRSLYRDLDATFDDLTFDEACQIEALAHSPGGHEDMIDTGKIDISNVHTFSLLDSTPLGLSTPDYN